MIVDDEPVSPERTFTKKNRSGAARSRLLPANRISVPAVLRTFQFSEIFIEQGRHFRNLLIADVVSDIGTFMQSVGAASLMVALGAGPIYVALRQTASALPYCLFALPAGLGEVQFHEDICASVGRWLDSFGRQVTEAERLIQVNGIG
jgi:hypothetical protein